MLKLFFLFFLAFFIGSSYAFDGTESFDSEFEALLNQTNQSPARRDEIMNPNQLPAELVVRDKTKIKKKKQDVLRKEVIKSNKNWTFLTANPKGQEVCYSLVYAQKRIGNMPKKESEENLKAYFMVHYFSPIKKRMSIFFDYTLNRGSKAYLSIDGEQFEFTSYEEYAFAEDAQSDQKILEALLSGKRVLVRGEGAGGFYSVDEYDVSGFAEIYEQMKEKCGKI